MSVRADVLLWAQRVIARRAAAAHEILELKPTASVDDAQAAFHKLAKIAHPDLHRNGMTPEELEQVTSAYSIAALAIGWKAVAGCSGVTIHQNFTKSVCALISRSISARAAAIVSIFTIVAYAATELTHLPPSAR